MQETRKKSYTLLPKDIRKVIESEEMEASIAEIGKGFDLHVDQLGVVYGVTNAILFGNLSPNQFIPIVVKEAKIDHDTALAIAKEINEKIFLPIRESLKKIHGVGEVAGDEKPREAAPLEPKNDVLQAIEAPETVPMRTRVIEPPVSQTPPPAPISPQPPAPVTSAVPVTNIAPMKEMMKALPSSFPSLAEVPAPQKTSTLTVPPPPNPQEKPTTFEAKKIDPYRELAN